MKTIIKNVGIENKNRKTIQELFSDYYNEYTPKEFDFGVPTGEEIL